MMFWICATLAIFLGSVALLNIPIGLGLQFIGMILAGNAYARLARGQPQKTSVTRGFMWLAAVVSVLGTCVGLAKLLQQ